MTADDTCTALARRAVACKGWRWLPGMLAFGVPWVGCAARLLRTEMMEQDTFNGTPILDAEFWFFDGGFCRIEAACKWLPDLSDSATLGCIEHGLLPEAWDDQDIGVCPQPWEAGGWETKSREGNVIGFGWTKAEALVAALEADP